MPSPTIVWFRSDLRLADNPALTAAVARGGPIVPVYLWSPDEEGEWPPGAASRWWLHQSLEALATGLAGKGTSLILRRGPAETALRSLAQETGARVVFWNRRYEPAARQIEEKLADALPKHGLEVQSFNASLLFEADEIRTTTGTPFRVFTSFWRACRSKERSPDVQKAPTRLRGLESPPKSLDLDDFRLEPTIDWAGGMRAAWQPGEQGAAARLAQFLDGGVFAYTERRDRPDVAGVSCMSPHLHFGEIGPRQIWRAVVDAAKEKRGALHAVSEGYLRQLIWREFAHHLLVHFPHTVARPRREEFAGFPWRKTSKDLRAWQRGRTGYPLVDAGMRQLWQTGWMHNRVRMVVASFLIKHLLIDWREGARWFWDTLVDADLANNTLGWQWTAGCGADAAPYFRIFNPVTQGEKFDPSGDYVRRYVPELAGLDAESIQHPFATPELILAEAGIRLGRDYPRPIVDHAEARQRALAALATITAAKSR